MKDASTCNLKLGVHDILDKKTKIKFGIITHRLEGLLDSVHIDIWGPIRLHHLEVISTLSRLLMIYLGDVGYTL